MTTDTDKLREALEVAAIWHEAQEKALSKQPPEPEKGWRRLEHQEQVATLRAALAAAPQPVPATVPCCICFKPCVTAEDGGPECELRDGIWTCSRECYAKHPSVVEGDALLARGLRLPGEETMAWAVVGRDGNVLPFTCCVDKPEICTVSAERVVRVAIRVVEGGDDAA